MIRHVLIVAAAFLASHLPISPAACSTPASEVRSIDPMDSDYSDLRALGEAIGDGRIVMLGETSHGDGSTFLAKTRVVRYLHEELGFDVIAFESGFYDLDVAERRLAAGERAAEVLAQSVFPVWSKSDQFQPLATYIGETRRSRRPLTVAGFDMQFTSGPASRLPADLRALGTGPFERVADLVAAVVQRVPKALDALDEARLDRDIAAMVAEVAKLPDASFWRQALESVRTNLRFVKNAPKMIPAVFDSRERQMASNMEWLAKQFGDRKIIVWAATSHVLRDRTAIDVQTAKAMVPMGAYFSRTPAGKQSYVLAFNAGKGKMGSMMRAQPMDVGEAPDGSYEAELLASGRDYAFVPLRTGEKRVARMLGYAPWTGEWGRAIDGMFFIREMQPTTYSSLPRKAPQSDQSRPMSR